MALAYTSPTWTDGSGTGISASQLQALCNCVEGLVQGSDKALHNIAINGSTITLTFADGSQETASTNVKGISSIAKTGTAGLVDTYTITYTDGSTSTFTVTNGDPSGDPNAYHTDDANESILAQGDKFPFYDASVSEKRSITWEYLKSNLYSYLNGYFYNKDDHVVNYINDADYIPTYNVENHLKKNITWSDIKAKLKTYFDTLYNKYELPAASTSTLGGVKVDGTTVTIDNNGVISSSGGGGGASALVDLTDVNISNPTDGQILQYDSTSQKWINAINAPVPIGSTVTPTDDILTWLHCAAIWDKSYSTIGQVLADSTTLLALISSNNAVDYMVRSTTWVSSVTASSSAMTIIGANNYCANTLLTDSTWRTSICNSSYFENVLNVKVPTMTSDTTPSGEALCYSVAGTATNAWKAFDNDIETGGGAGGGLESAVSLKNSYIGYDFGRSVKIYKVLGNMNFAGINATRSLALIGSNDKSTWTTISTNSYTHFEEDIYNVVPSNGYRYYALRMESNDNTLRFTGRTIQFYGRA